MKILLAVVFVVLYANCVTADATGLSPDVQKKLIEELNKDRKKAHELTGREYVPISYDPELEKELSKPGSCFGPGVRLNWNDVEEEYQIWQIKRMNFSQPRYLDLFDPYQLTIGCSPSLECTRRIAFSSFNPPQLQGKIAESYGMCLLHGESRLSLRPALSNVKDQLPPLSKYADIIGVAGPHHKPRGGGQVEVAGTKPENGSDWKTEKEKGGRSFIFEIDDKQKYSKTLAMKVLLAIFCIAFYACSVSANEIRAKRGLSADEQKKLVDEVNKDRQEMAKKTGLTINPLTYDVNLEKNIEKDQNCEMLKGESLKTNSVGDALDEEYKKNPEEGPEAYVAPAAFFLNPKASKIGCSKTFKCSVKVSEDMAGKGSKLIGQIWERYGNCQLDIRPDHGTMKKITKAGPPSVSKYADILGVTGSSGRVFSLLISLFLVIYI